MRPRPVAPVVARHAAVAAPAVAASHAFMAPFATALPPGDALHGERRSPMLRLIHSVSHLIAPTSSVYPNWLLNWYQRQLSEAWQAVQKTAAEKQALQAVLARSLGLDPARFDTDAAAPTTSPRRPHRNGRRPPWARRKRRRNAGASVRRRKGKSRT